MDSLKSCNQSAMLVM